jgi:NADPH2:quinone reductase
MKALCFERFGGPEVLEYRDLPEPIPGPGEALVRLSAIGLNFADIYRRRGNYHLAGTPPYVPGYEGAGVVERVNAEGSALNDLPAVKVSQRVAFADSPYANAELAVVSLEKLIPLPDDISFETAAALLLQGLTAQYLTRDSHRITPNEQAIVHAAAGGVGLLLVQIIKLLDGKVIALTSSETKRVAALNAGADAVVLYGEDWPDAVLKLTRDHKGADVVYDSVGATLDASLRVARQGGQVVFYGMAGGDPALVDPRQLMDESKTLTGGDLWNVLTSRGERISRAAELFAWVRAGKLTVRISEKFSLREGAKAHAHLESRQSTGKVLLIPA